jgi:hypothetical protein
MTIFQDVSDYHNINDWFAIIPAVLIVECICLYIYPNYSPILKKWYTLFTLQAGLQDVLIIIIGFGIVRYIYTYLLNPRFGFNIILFTTLFLICQIIHDLSYALFIILLPGGKYKMIDYMKEYISVAKWNAVIGDATMIIGSSIFASLLKNLSNHYNILFSFIGLYNMIYLVNI